MNNGHGSHKWPENDGVFRVGINMAGAVSAGAYTAGALDFLIEALEKWQIQKESKPRSVPGHGVSIDVFSGASAGGMCAAIAAVLVQGPFDHITDPGNRRVQETSNRFYESWVNQIDMERLLGNTDLQQKTTCLASLLDSTIIDDIAEYALRPVETEAVRPPYISESLALFLTLTNVRGVPYALDKSGAGSAEEYISYYADKLEFETVPNFLSKPKSHLAVALSRDGQGLGWALLRDAAKATGAFPLFLAPRRLVRRACDYYYRPWLSTQGSRPARVPPAWTLDEKDPFDTLNVDGGLTNNNPFQLAHDFLVSRNPLATHNGTQNPREANKANCAVLTIAPFTDNAVYDPEFDSEQSGGVLRILPRIISALLGQSRFFGESLAVVTDGKSSRFVIAPSKSNCEKRSVLQCGLLGAFGGFLERSFRAHDYQLGRRNCQRFLREYFRLDEENPIIQQGMSALTEEERKAVFSEFGSIDQGRRMLPIIPLCDDAKEDVGTPTLGSITREQIDEIVGWGVRRLRKISGPLIDEIFGQTPGRWFARIVASAFILTMGKSRLKTYLTRELRDVTHG